MNRDLASRIRLIVNTKQLQNSVFCLIVFTILHVWFLSQSNPNYSFLGVHSLIVIVWSLFFLIVICKNRVLSFKPVFILLLWVFHFGYFPLYLWGRDSSILFNDLVYYTEQEVLNGYSIGIVLLYAFVIGFTFSPNASENNWMRNTKVEVPTALIQKIRIVFFILLVPFLINTIINLLAGSYADVLTRYSSGLLAYSNLFLYSFAILLFQNAVRTNKKGTIILLYFIFAFSSLTGQRIDCISLVLTFVLIQNSGKRLKSKNVIITLLIIVVGLYFVSTIGRYRQNFGVMIDQLLSIENLIGYIVNNPFSMLLEEFGGTVASLLGAIKYYSNGNYLYGVTYLAGLTYIIPKLNSIFPSKYLTFVSIFPEKIAHGLGGSVLGELYSNFGAYSVFFAFVLAIVIGNLSFKDEKYSDQEVNYFYQWWKNVLIFTFVLVIRGYFKNIVFLAFWIYILSKYFTKKYKKCD